MLTMLRTNRDLRTLFIAQVVSYMGDWFCYVALIGLVNDLTDSSLLVALVFVSQALPGFLVAPIAGCGGRPLRSPPDHRHRLLRPGRRRDRPPGRRSRPGLAGLPGPGHHRRLRRVRGPGLAGGRAQPGPGRRRAQEGHRAVRLDVGRHAGHRRGDRRCLRGACSDGTPRSSPTPPPSSWPPRWCSPSAGPCRQPATRREARRPPPAPRRHEGGAAPRQGGPGPPRPAVVQGDVRPGRGDRRASSPCWSRTTSPAATARPA